MRSSALLVPVISLLIASCGAQNPPEPPIANVTILDPQFGDKVLEQCSREAPPKGDSYFRPTRGEIVRFERVLQGVLDANSEFQADRKRNKSLGYDTPTSVANDWARDIIGINRGGRRFIYGSYYSRNDKSGPDHTEPVRMCDGGPSIFGAEFDIERGVITHLAFNGAI